MKDIPLSIEKRQPREGRQPGATLGQPSSPERYPPVFVMNPYYSGLGIARSLRGRGMPVFALTSEPDAPGARSRHFDGVHIVPNGRDEPQHLCRRLLEIAREYDAKPVIFPTRDFDILFLHDYREALAPFFLLPQPHDSSSIMRMMDKLDLAKFAEQIGVATPITVSSSSGEDIERQ